MESQPNDTDAHASAFRRTSSTPALTSIVEGRSRIVLPPCWLDVLTETHRTRLETYEDGMHLHRTERRLASTTVALTADPAEDTQEEPVLEEKHSASGPHSEAGDSTPAATPVPTEPLAEQDTQEKVAPVSLNDTDLAAEGAEGEATVVTTPAPTTSDATVTAVEAPADEVEAEKTPVEAVIVEPYDAEQMASWLDAYRHTVQFCPPGIAAFVKRRPDDRATADPRTGPLAAPGASALVGHAGTIDATGPARGGLGAGHAAKNVPQFGTKLGDGHAYGHAHYPPHHGGGPGLSSSWGTAGNTGKSGLEAIEQLWEDRKDIPISMGSSLRRRGLFGDAEKKEIHQMVTAVLNKVTTDPAKFREVKNELLRLPIPEANESQLDSVVDVFVHKAISEPDFCHSYADLLVALCKVPQGQEKVMDPTQTLDYRLRRAIVTRCQDKFLEGTSEQAAEHARLVGREARRQGVAPEDVKGIPATEYDFALIADQEGEDLEEAEARTKELRDSMCGIVRFVSELHLRHMITPNVVTVIFFVCLTGSGEGNLTVPPTYLPTESQMDEVITILHTAGKQYFLDNKKGRNMLPSVLRNLEYWTEHYPVSRIRFLLISESATLRQWYMAMRSGVVASASASPGHHPAPAPDALMPVAAHTMPMPAAVAPATGWAPNIPVAHPAPMPPQPPLAAAPTMGVTAAGSSADHATAAAAARPTLALNHASPTHEPSLTSPTLTNSANGSPKTGIPAPRSSRLASAAAAAAQMNSQTLTSRTATPGGTSPLPSNFDEANQQAAALADVNVASASAPQNPPQPLPPAPSQLAGPVQTVRPPLKQAVRPAHVVELMTKLSKANKDDPAAVELAAEEVARSMEETYGDVLPCLSKWLDRCVTVAKEDKARQRTPLVLRRVLQLGASPPSRDELRDEAVSALERAVLANIQDELHIFRFWAQLVLADGTRGVLDEEMLNEGLAMLMARCPAAAGDYLTDVGKLHAAAVQSDNVQPYVVATHDCFYPRYRPLLWVYNACADQAADVTLALLNQSALRQVSLEVDIFCALITGQPSQDNVFAKLRESPRLVRADPTLAAEVMSALMMAEICSALKPFIENNLVLMQTVVDGVSRRERERAMLAEIHHITNYADCSLPVGYDLRLVHKLTSLRVLSHETAEEASVCWQRQQIAARAAAAAAAASAMASPNSTTASDPARSSAAASRERSPVPAAPLQHLSNGVSPQQSSGNYGNGAANNHTPHITPRGRSGRGGNGQGPRFGSRGGTAHGLPPSAMESFTRTSSGVASSDTNSNRNGRGRRGSGLNLGSTHAKGGHGNGHGTGSDGGGSMTPNPTLSLGATQPRGSQVSHGSFSANSSVTGAGLGSGGGASPAGAGAGAGAGGSRWGSFGSPKSTRSSSDTFDAVAASYRAKYMAGGARGANTGDKKRGGGRGGGRGRK